MMDYFGTHSPDDDKLINNIGLTASEVASSMIPILIGMVIVGLIAVLMLL